MLRHRHECRSTPAVQILQQFVHVQDQRVFLGHRGPITIEAVDHHGLDVVLIDPLADAVREFAGRQLRGVQLLDEEVAAALHLFEVDAEPLHARKQQAELLVEHEQRRLFATRDRGGDEDDRQKGISRCRGSKNKRARSRFEPPPRSRSSSAMTLDIAVRIPCRVFLRHQPSETRLYANQDVQRIADWTGFSAAARSGIRARLFLDPRAPGKILLAIVFIAAAIAVAKRRRCSCSTRSSACCLRA